MLSSQVMRIGKWFMCLPEVQFNLTFDIINIILFHTDCCIQQAFHSIRNFLNDQYECLHAVLGSIVEKFLSLQAIFHILIALNDEGTYLIDTSAPL